MSTNPPSKSNKGTAKAEKKAESKASDSEKKPRAPRQNYGFEPDAVIEVTVKGEEIPKFRGQRLDWFEKLQKFNGKTVKEFLDKNQGKDSPRGWLRFFVAEAKVATLTAAKKAA